MKAPADMPFAARRVRIADGAKHRVFDKGVERMPGDEVWIPWASDDRAESRSTHISNLPADVSLKTLAAAVKARWICEQAHQQLKEELGLDHFEGRSWAGLHRAAPFDDDDRLCLPPIPPPHRSGTEKRVSGPPPQPSMPAIRQAILDLFVRPPPLRCTHCEMLLARLLQLNLPE